MQVKIQVSRLYSNQRSNLAVNGQRSIGQLSMEEFEISWNIFTWLKFCYSTMKGVKVLRKSLTGPFPSKLWRQSGNLLNSFYKLGTIRSLTSFDFHVTPLGFSWISHSASRSIFFARKQLVVNSLKEVWTPKTAVSIDRDLSFIAYHKSNSFIYLPKFHYLWVLHSSFNGLSKLSYLFHVWEFLHSENVMTV